MTPINAFRFRAEREMYEVLLPAIPSIFGTVAGERMTVLREPAIGQVIPDLLIGIWTGDLPYKRDVTNVARHILAELQRTAGTFNKLSNLEERLLIGPEDSAYGIKQLRRMGAVIVEESGEIRLTPSFVDSTVKLIAVELKLERWKDALQQAERYLDFADEAYVLLDCSRVVLTPEISNAFSVTPVGLMVERRCRLEVAIPALTASAESSADRVLALQKLAAAPFCVA